MEQARVRIPDESFVGDYDGPGSGEYRDRTVSWVYGQGTPYHTMTSSFRLKRFGQIGRRASIVLVGLDGGSEGKSRIAIVLNGTTIYKGRNRLPDDDCCGETGDANWGTAVVRLPGSLLRRNNELSITNLEPADCIFCPDFVMVDYAVLRYRFRP